MSDTKWDGGTFANDQYSSVVIGGEFATSPGLWELGMGVSVPAWMQERLKTGDVYRFEYGDPPRWFINEVEQFEADQETKGER